MVAGMLVKKGLPVMEEKIVTILNEMSEYLSIEQMKKLQEVMLDAFSGKIEKKKQISNQEYLRMFLAAKTIEGCSKRTIQYYRVTIEKMLTVMNQPIRKITTEDMRSYLSQYQEWNGCSKVTVDNVRRNISSFFSWLEEENYILKSPMRRIHKIKTNQQVKEIITDEDIERLRDSCSCKRDLAMIELLYSTGIRVGELVNLNISDVYFDAKSKLHLQAYLSSRVDDNEALFVTLDAPHDRLKISGVEIRMRSLGRINNMTRIHPHKFRRTMATRAIDKGMPIEQVQKILGHSQIDTTMKYAMVNQSNVKTSHQKYIS